MFNNDAIHSDGIVYFFSAMTCWLWFSQMDGWTGLFVHGIQLTRCSNQTAYTAKNTNKQSDAEAFFHNIMASDSIINVGEAAAATPLCHLNAARS